MSWQELGVAIAALVLIELYVEIRATTIAAGVIREAVHVRAF